MNGFVTLEEARRMTPSELLHYASCGLLAPDPELLARAMALTFDHFCREYDELTEDHGAMEEELHELERKLEEANEALEKAGLPWVK